LCEGYGVHAARHHWQAWLVALLVMAAGLSCAAQTTRGAASSTDTAAQSTNVAAQPTNIAAPSATVALQPATVAAQPTSPPPTTASAPPPVESAAQGFDESAFRIIAERNIFNANRIGPVRLSSRRPSVVETFTLVGTMAYEKGAFAFFQGSSSEFTKVLKPAGLIAGHKLVDICANSVKIEVDGKEFELPVGSQMRREDEGTWQVAEARGGGDNAAPGTNGEPSSRNGRSDRGRDYSRSRGDSRPSGARDERAESRSPAPAAASSPNVNQDEVLKRLMERREKESQ
jgi:hypothetical protein